MYVNAYIHTYILVVHMAWRRASRDTCATSETFSSAKTECVAHVHTRRCECHANPVRGAGVCRASEYRIYLLAA